MVSRRDGNKRSNSQWSLGILALCAACGVLSLFTMTVALRGAKSPTVTVVQSISPRQAAVLPTVAMLDFTDWIRNKVLFVEFIWIDPIDAHTHIAKIDPPFREMLERLHLHVLNILYVDDHQPSRTSLAAQRQDAFNVADASAGRVLLCTSFDPFRISDAGSSQAAITWLNQDFARGAIAVKVWKNVGMEIRNGSGRYVMPDDSSFEPVYRDIASQHKTLVIHAADPDAAWASQYATGASTKYYAEHPEWDMSNKQGAPSKAEILSARNHLLELNPDLEVVGAHFGSMDAQLNELSRCLDRYPNFAVDTAARLPHISLEPRLEVRDFFIKYQDRIVYGTDFSYDAEPEHTNMANSKAWEDGYLAEWRYLATDDTFKFRGHQVQGLDLPRSVLKKIYHDNAVRWIPGIDSSSH